MNYFVPKNDSQSFNQIRDPEVWHFPGQNGVILPIFLSIPTFRRGLFEFFVKAAQKLYDGSLVNQKPAFMTFL